MNTPFPLTHSRAVTLSLGFSHCCIVALLPDACAAMSACAATSYYPVILQSAPSSLLLSTLLVATFAVVRHLTFLVADMTHHVLQVLGSASVFKNK